MTTETPANPVDAIWSDDLLERRGEAFFLRDYIHSKIEERKRLELTGSYVVNIDAEWGAGKTFFLDHFARQLEYDGYVVARVNAWRDDHLDDPFVAILAAIDEALKPYVGKKDEVRSAWQAVKKNAVPVVGKLGAGLVKTVVKRYVGKEALDAIEELVVESGGESDEKEKSAAEDVIEGAITETVIQIENIIDAGAQKLIDTFNEKNKSTETFRKKLGDAVEALGKLKRAPLFVFVDELDRCRPSYAIALLERVKHLFEADNVVFIFATNSGELRHIVAGAYGPSFDGFKYLKRFFDRTYLLTKPETRRLIALESDAFEAKKLRAPIELSEFLSLGFQSYDSNPREIKQAFDLMSSVTAAWDNPIPIEVCLLFPLVMSFLRTNSVNVLGAEMQIPSDFIITLRQQRSRYYSDGRDREARTSVKEIFHDAANLMKNLDGAPRFGGDSPSAQAAYVYECFVPEWSGKQVIVGRVSAQTQLSRLIGYAGNFAADTIP